MGRPSIELDPSDLIMKYNSDMSLDEIAKFYEVSPSTVRRKILSTNPNFNFRALSPIKGKPRKRIHIDADGEMDPEVFDTICKMYFDENLNAYQIHEALGYTVSDIYAAITKKKLEGCSPDEIMNGRPLSKTRRIYRCVYCNELLPKGSRRITCDNGVCLKAHRRERYKRIKLAKVKKDLDTLYKKREKTQKDVDPIGITLSNTIDYSVEDLDARDRS